MPILEFHGPVEEWDLKPDFQPENDPFEEDPRKNVRFDYLTGQGRATQNGLLSPAASQASFGRVSVASEDLFATGKDDIVYEG